MPEPYMWNCWVGLLIPIPILACAWIFPVAVVTPAILTLSKFVWPSTSKSALQSIPDLAVITPTESTFITSS